MNVDLTTKTDAEIQQAVDDCQATKNVLDGLGVNTGLYKLTLDVLRHEQERRAQAIRNEELLENMELLQMVRDMDLGEEK